MCEKMDATRKCLSSGECRVCKFVAVNSLGAAVNKYEGCDITSSTPICDANTAVANVQFATNAYDGGSLTPACVQCKKMGEYHNQSA